MQLPIQIDQGLGQNLQTQIYDQICSLIADGRLSPGVRMPASRALAIDLGVSRNTVVSAYHRLTEEGFLEMREPVGTFVARRVPTDSQRPAEQASEAPPETLSVPRGHRLQFRGEAHAVVNPFEPPVEFDFWVGRPDARLFPIRVWRSLLTGMLRSGTKTLCEYGDPRGLPALREAIANHIGAARGIAADPNQILITNGIQEGLTILARLLVAPGVDVAVENPCYRGASHVFASYGAKLHPGLVDKSGIDPASLPNSAALAYVTPSHQYPLGVPLSMARREELLEWSRSCGAYIAEDDYDSDFFYDESPMRAVKSMARHDQVVYLGTFSKSLGAGLRIGYMVLPRDLCAPAAQVKALMNNCQPWLEQAALAAFIAEGDYSHHLRRLRRAYADRRNCLTATIASHFPGWQVHGGSGGMHVAVQLPADGVRADVVEKIARASGVGVYSLANSNAQIFGAEMQDSLDRTLLLGYASLNETEICEAILRLRQAIDLTGDGSASSVDGTEGSCPIQRPVAA